VRGYWVARADLELAVGGRLPEPSDQRNVPKGE
jgi:hypothetical protein